jgi:hypothetical protein
MTEHDPTIAHLLAALQYALGIIENYEMDIRDSAWTGVNLQERGFCQGVIYRDAVRDILRRARGDVPVDPPNVLSGALARAVLDRQPYPGLHEDAP